MTKILVIEDDPDMCYLLREFFSREGYEVTTITHGSRAVDAANSLRPDLIFLDVMLPGLDGFQLCRLFRGDPSYAGTPILILTAKNEDADRAVAFDVGATDFWTKPFDIRELLKRVQELLRGKRLGLYDEE